MRPVRKHGSITSLDKHKIRRIAAAHGRSCDMVSVFSVSKVSSKSQIPTLSFAHHYHPLARFNDNYDLLITIDRHIIVSCK